MTFTPAGPFTLASFIAVVGAVALKKPKTLEYQKKRKEMK